MARIATGAVIGVNFKRLTAQTERLYMIAAQQHADRLRSQAAELLQQAREQDQQARLHSQRYLIASGFTPAP